MQARWHHDAADFTSREHSAEKMQDLVPHIFPAFHCLPLLSLCG